MDEDDWDDDYPEQSCECCDDDMDDDYDELPGSDAVEQFTATEVVARANGAGAFVKIVDSIEAAFTDPLRSVMKKAAARLREAQDAACAELFKDAKFLGAAVTEQDSTKARCPATHYGDGSACPLCKGSGWVDAIG